MQEVGDSPTQHTDIQAGKLLRLWQGQWQEVDIRFAWLARSDSSLRTHWLGGDTAF